MLSQLLMLFGFFSLVLVSVYWVNRAVSLFDQLIGDGQSAVVFLEFTLLTLPNVIRLVLPISAFVATVYVVNRLITDSELVVMQAAGRAECADSAIGTRLIRDGRPGVEGPRREGAGMAGRTSFTQFFFKDTTKWMPHAQNRFPWFKLIR